MYLCERCGVSTPAGASSHKVVAIWRTVKYPPRRGCNRPIFQWNSLKKKMEPRPGSADDPGGTGREIVREIKVCDACVGHVATIIE